jgi:hypothetical protein
VDVFEWSKVHDRESLARPDPVIWPVESDRVEETGLRNNSDNSVGFTCGYEHRAGLEQTGELRTPGQTSTNSGHGDAARSRDGTGNRSKEQVRSLQTYLSILHTVGTRTGRNCRPPMRLHRSTTRVMRLGLTEMKWLAGLQACHAATWEWRTAGNCCMLLYPSELLSSLCQSFPVERKIFLCSSSSVLVVARTRAAAILKTSTTAAATVGTFAAGV